MSRFPERTHVRDYRALEAVEIEPNDRSVGVLNSALWPPIASKGGEGDRGWGADSPRDPTWREGRGISCGEVSKPPRPTSSLTVGNVGPTMSSLAAYPGMMRRDRQRLGLLECRAAWLLG